MTPLVRRAAWQVQRLAHFPRQPVWAAAIHSARETASPSLVTAQVNLAGSGPPVFLWVSTCPGAAPSSNAPGSSTARPPLLQGLRHPRRADFQAQQAPRQAAHVRRRPLEGFLALREGLPCDHRQLAVKLQELSAEGLAPSDLERLLASDLALPRQHGRVQGLRRGLRWAVPPLREGAPVPLLLLADLDSAFLPNLCYLRAYFGSGASGSDGASSSAGTSSSSSSSLQLTPLGRLLVAQPTHMAVFLSQRWTHIRSLDSAIQAAGYRAADVAALFRAAPPPLVPYTLGLEAFAQKFEWLREETRYSLADLVHTHGCLPTALRRLASRLAFVRSLGVLDPPGMSLLARGTDEQFCGRLSTKLWGDGVSVQEFHSWVGGWLQTPAGRRWGTPPGAAV